MKRYKPNILLYAMVMSFGMTPLVLASESAVKDEIKTLESYNTPQKLGAKNGILKVNLSPRTITETVALGEHFEEQTSQPQCTV